MIYERTTADAGFSNPVIRWIDYRLPLFTFLRHELDQYSAPRNLNYLWNFGSLAGIVLLGHDRDRHRARDALRSDRGGAFNRSSTSCVT